MLADLEVIAAGIEEGRLQRSVSKRGKPNRVSWVVMWRKSLGVMWREWVYRAAPVASLRSNFIQGTSRNCLIRSGKYA
jgi:hypothetical protein